MITIKQKECKTKMPWEMPALISWTLKVWLLTTFRKGLYNIMKDLIIVETLLVIPYLVSLCSNPPHVSPYQRPSIYLKQSSWCIYCLMLHRFCEPSRAKSILLSLRRLSLLKWSTTFFLKEFADDTKKTDGLILPQGCAFTCILRNRQKKSSRLLRVI